MSFLPKFGRSFGLSLIFIGGALAIPSCAHTPLADRELRNEFWSSLTLPLASGGTFQPQSCEGQVLLVYFMSTWCFPCLGELPVLAKLQKEQADQGFRVIAVGMDLEGARTLSPFEEDQKLPFPILIANERMISGQSAFGPIRGLPSTVVFDRRGKVIAAYNGLAENQKLSQLIARLVADKSLQP